MSCASNRLDLVIKKGKTFTQQLRWEGTRFVYKTITAATLAAPCVLTVPSHQMPNGWACQILGAQGMAKLNKDPDTGLFPNGLDTYYGTVLDANTIELNDVTALQALGFKAYTGGGVLAYRVPTDLTGYTARLKAKSDKGTTTALLDLTSASGIVIDATNKIVSIVLTEAQTAALSWEYAVYDLEMVAPDGTVTELVQGVITVVDEVTKP